MTNRKVFTLISIALLIFNSCNTWEEKSNPYNNHWLAEAPAGNDYTQIIKDGETIIPNGRIITPPEKTFLVAPHPYGLAISPDGNTLVTANSGISPLSITIIRNIYDEQPEIQQIPDGARADRGILASVFMGLAITPENDKIYVGGGQENKIYIFDLHTGNGLGHIDCSYQDEEVDYTHGYIGDLVLSKDGKYIYAVDQINFRMLIIDATNQKLVKSIPVGRYPFGICLSPDEKEVYVANVGMYEYKFIPGVDPGNFIETALKFPPFAYLSKESIDGIESDTLNVPGLGDPNAPESFSVWTVDLEKEEVTAKVKTGILVGEKIEDTFSITLSFASSYMRQ